MATILLIPWPEYGHLNPALKLARNLKQAGHRVCCLGLSDFEEYISSQGLEFFPFLKNKFPAGYLSGRACKMGLDAFSLMLLECQAGDGNPKFTTNDEIKREIKSLLQKIGPDLLIVDYGFDGLGGNIAQEFHIPTALLSVMLIGRLQIGKWQQPAGPRIDLPVLILCPQEFEFPYVAKQSGHYHIESSIDLERREPDSFPWETLDNTKPLIYCSLGSLSHRYKQSSRFFRTLIEVMRLRRDSQLVLATGLHLDPADLGAVPDNVFVTKWVPQLQMIRRASVMITHGGLGTVKDCIFYGVPMIVFPIAFDQPMNAARVAYHGLGLRGNIETTSARQIDSLISRINDDPAFKTSVESMSRVFRAIENSGRGARVIAKILKGRSGERHDLQTSLGAMAQV